MIPHHEFVFLLFVFDVFIGLIKCLFAFLVITMGFFFIVIVKAHIHISLYESNTLQEQGAALLFLSVIP